MTTGAAQVVIPSFTGNARDVMTNTWHFTTNDVDFELEAGVFVAALNSFYDDVYGDSDGAANCYVWSDVYVNCYDLSTPKPRVPVQIPMPVDAVPANASTPQEVAVCLSYAATMTPGIPAGRQRGRIYLGGLTGNWISSSSVSEWTTLSGDNQLLIASAAAAILSDLTVSGVRWVVHSAAAGTDFEVTHGWVDDALDSQRRRGGDSTGRLPWGV